MYNPENFRVKQLWSGTKVQADRRAWYYSFSDFKTLRKSSLENGRFGCFFFVVFLIVWTRIVRKFLFGKLINCTRAKPGRVASFPIFPIDYRIKLHSRWTTPQHKFTNYYSTITIVGFSKTMILSWKLPTYLNVNMHEPWIDRVAVSKRIFIYY